MARQTLAQSAFTTDTKLVFQSKDYDTTNSFDHTTNYRFQPTIAGYYLLCAGLGVTTATGTGSVAIRKNGDSASAVNNVSVANMQAGGVGQMVGSTLMYLNGSSDYVEVYGTFSVSQQPFVSATKNWTFFTGALVAAA